MPGGRAGIVNLNLKENFAPNQTQRLSRSPHPYYRSRNEVLQDNGAAVPSAQSAVLSPALHSPHPYPGHGPTYFDADHRKRRKPTSSPSESGTDADDEKGGSLLRLPAPPARLRKGLKGSTYSGTASPLFTPSYLDEVSLKLALEAQTKRPGSLRTQSYTDEERIKLQERFVRKRRAEFIRRLTETLLLGMVGFIACRSEIGCMMSVWAENILDTGNVKWDFDSSCIPIVLLSHATVISGLYILYPLRIIYKNHAENASKKRSRLHIHIPAAFEPAPLLYPVLVPVFVTLSLMHTDPGVLVANLVLSIASIPSTIIPISCDVPWYSSIHWLISLIPLQACSTLYLNHYRPSMQSTHSMLKSFDPETFTLLYPLHQALLRVLGSLTTTSLLPAELQLLSVSMIDVLTFSISPQAVILQSLLWLGGLSVLILCDKALIWGVVLARIPSWRFRHTRTRAREGNIVVSAMDDCLHGRLSKWRVTAADSQESESDDLQSPRSTRPRQKDRKMPSNVLRQVEEAEDGTFSMLSNPIHSTISNTMQAALEGPDDSIETCQADVKRQRRHSLPSYVRSTQDSPLKQTRRRGRTSLFPPTKAWSFRSLTKAQAVVIKWVLALYVYAMVIAIIIFGVRPYVGRWALRDQEPVGWALGYLLGDLPTFRSYTMYWNLENWIRLYPISVKSPSITAHDYWVQSYQHKLGAANVRLLICIYCITVVASGLAVVLRLSATVEVDTRRKVFHGMMVVMFLPTIFVDPTFVSLALILTLAVFLLLDLFRASQLPPLSKPLSYFLAPYVDGRDNRGPVIVSHIFLLIGCAIPLWLSLAAIGRTGLGPWEGWTVERRAVSMISGVVCVGMGDAAASLIGRRFGRRRWCWSGGKSLEGSLAFAVAVSVGLCFARGWLLIGGWDADYGDSWGTTVGKACVAAIGASLTEAVLTGGNDNVIVPVILWLLVRGLRI